MSSREDEFAGFGSEAIGFFRGLEADNSHEYFEAHKEVWDAAVRRPMSALLLVLAPKFGGKFRIFRQERRLRFSRDRSPYKLKTYGVIGGRAGSAAALYVEVSSKGLFAASGYYELAPDQLTRYRAAVADEARGVQLEQLLKDAVAQGLSVSGTVAGAPRGTAKNHPRLALLRQHSLLCGARLGAEDPALGERAALEFVNNTWNSGASITAWLDDNVGPSAPSAPSSRQR